MLDHWFEGDDQKSVPATRKRFADKGISIFPVPVEVAGGTGMILVGSSRVDSPGQTESLLLSVAANEASIGLKEAWLLNQQKRTANQLERQVAERTEGLAATNEKLKKSEAALHKAFDEIKQIRRKTPPGSTQCSGSPRFPLFREPGSCNNSARKGRVAIAVDIAATQNADECLE